MREKFWATMLLTLAAVYISKSTNAWAREPKEAVDEVIRIFRRVEGYVHQVYSDTGAIVS